MGSKQKNKKYKSTKKQKQILQDYEDPDSNEEFAYIAGYTSWGFPYGIRWDELEENDTIVDAKESHKKDIKSIDIEFDLELPFD